MWKVLVGAVALLASIHVWAASESTMSLLDNRFRVDPSIEQITFVIYRANNSRPVVLVRPDGKKYYAWKAPENVRWYEESSMDIISIEHPMPGPWQAVGKVTPKNHIKMLSNLKLVSDTFPARLYQGEEIKFTARLTSDGKPLQIREFLDKIHLKVTFTKYIENEEALVKEARPIPDVLGEFSDDGKGLDEKAGDGEFTVGLKIHSEPGKYRVRITSGNGVFLRAQEQEVLVYPTPYSATFIQSRVTGQPHHIVLSGEQGMVTPGSLATQIEHKDSQGATSYYDAQADKDDLKVTVNIPNGGELGQYSWSGTLYTNDLASGRSLVFPINEHTYSIVSEIDLEQTRLMREKEAEMQRKIQQENDMLQAREEARKSRMMAIAIGNVVVILLGLIAWFVIGKLKARKALQPEMQLDMPKKK